MKQFSSMLHICVKINHNQNFFFFYDELLVFNKIFLENLIRTRQSFYTVIYIFFLESSNSVIKITNESMKISHFSQHRFIENLIDSHQVLFVQLNWRYANKPKTNLKGFDLYLSVLSFIHSLIFSTVLQIIYFR